MIKPKKLNKGDKVALVSLSSGLFGDEANKARLDRTINNLKNLLEIEPILMPNALIGSREVYEHPELRAKDLMDAFKEIKSIIKSGDVVLLSPASASLDQYKECEVRGKEFKDYVKELEK